MDFILLTQYNGMIVGPIAKLLGIIMNAIFNFCNVIGIPNIGLCIILFTIIVNLIILPMTINQQKFSKMTSIMNPELQKIQEKYKNKKDQESMMKQQAEQQAIYEKYGVSPMAGCLPLLIQMPILFALYRVILMIPAYVSGIKDVFMNIVNLSISQTDFIPKITQLAESNGMPVDKFDLTGATTESINYVVDLFYKFDRVEWNSFTDIFPNIAGQVQPFIDEIMHMNSFMGGINLAEAPGFRLSIALVIPILAGLTQWFSTKLMTAVTNNQSMNSDNPMASSMKMMNTIMPIFSVLMCISLPAGVGLYWVASSVVRVIQQIGINAYMDKLDINDIIQKNMDKQNAKRKKKGLPPIKQNATVKAGSKTIKQLTEETKKNTSDPKPQQSPQKKQDSKDYYEQKGYKSSSIASKAKMVKDFNEKSGKK